MLVASAAVLWLLAVGLSWSSACPQPAPVQLTGLDKAISAWPPGAHCLRTGPGSDVYVYEALPRAQAVIAGLVITAGVVLVLGLLRTVLDLRRRGADA